MNYLRSILFFFTFLFSLVANASLSEDLQSRKIIHLNQNRRFSHSTSIQTEAEMGSKLYVLVYKESLNSTQVENLLKKITDLKLNPQRIFTELREIHFESPKSERELKDLIHDPDIVEIHHQISFSIDE